MYSIKDLVLATSGKLIQGSEEGVIKSVCIDSRAVIPADVFFAIKGDVFDGHDFIDDVVAKGVQVIVVHKNVHLKKSSTTVILVKDTTKALGHWARFHRLSLKVPVIALTGSTGKTTTKEMIACVLQKKLNVLKSEGTQNNHIGVPLTLLKINSKHKVAVIECGTNQPGDIPWLADVVRPDVVVFTNIGHSHLEKLKTTKGVLKEKWSLTSWLNQKGAIIVNLDDPLLAQQVKTSKCKKIISYGVKNKSTIKATDLAVSQGVSLKFKISTKQFELKTCSINNVYNALAAYACGRFFLVPIDQIAVALKTFEFPKGRGQLMKLGAGWMINDSYNSNPTSMLNAIQMLMALHTQGKKIMVVADMLELGSKAKELHSQMGLSIARAKIDVLITVGALSRHIAARARKINKNMSVFACADIESAQKNIAKIFKNGDSVLIKGSRRMAMERMVDFLQTSPHGSI